MCGIVGYVGPRVASPLLVEGLKRLEYRGYDSAGVAIMNGTGVETVKEAGKISRLEAMLAAKPVHGTTGIAHTRWATHGAPNQVNAHPHVSEDGTIAVVHNGIIENAPVLRKMLEGRGYKITSDTDTEVLAHLIEEQIEGNLEDAVIEALRQVEARTVSPSFRASMRTRLSRRGKAAAAGRLGTTILQASDVSAILAHTARSSTSTMANGGRGSQWLPHRRPQRDRDHEEGLAH
jgi:glucosamine--fructose-6-phosphate aminotransferase (isomerizing)